MEHESQPQQVGGLDLPPPSLTPTQEDLCARLDDLHTLHGLRTKPSDMFKGAVFASQSQVRANPDWVSQAANSLREILYPFYSREVDTVATDKKEALEKYGSARANDTFLNDMGRIYGLLNGLTHHGNAKKSSVDFPAFTPLDFENLLSDFEKVMRDVLARQLDIHKEIDAIFAVEPPTAEAVVSPEITI